MPSGRIVATGGYDHAGRPHTLGLNVSGDSTYVSSMEYAAQAAVQQMTLGNALIEQTCYNARLQTFVIRQRSGAAVDCTSAGVSTADGQDVAHLAYSYGSANNGNVAGQTITFGAGGGNPSRSFQQDYTYDGANRLATASENGGGNSWAQTFGYDQVGNRWLSSHTGDPVVGSFVPTQGSNSNSSNQLTIQGAMYAGGNQTQIGGYTFTYDGEDRLTSTTEGGAEYGYDADGRRVTKQVGGVTTVYVYDLQGQLAAEYTSGGTVAAACTRCFLMVDHLGSTRMLTDGTGAQTWLYDYQPFGELLGPGIDGRDGRWSGPGSGLLFTGKMRDGETGGNSGENDGLDYFGARYFSGAQGRFTSPDPLLNSGRPDNPQSWNRYSYAFNNPLRFSDPNGLYVFGDCSGSAKECKDLQQRFKDSLAYLKQARDSYSDKKSSEYQRLDAALKAYGKFGDKGVTVAFGALGGTAAAQTTPMGDSKSFTVTFDPSKMSAGDRDTRPAQWMAIDTGHEGTHVDDITKELGGASQLSPFSLEYRGYESSALVFSGLFTPSATATQGSIIGGGTSRTLSFGGSTIWNTSWGAADLVTIQSRGSRADTGITNAITSVYGHTETTPHNPWGN